MLKKDLLALIRTLREEKLALLKELLANAKAVEELEPHFAQRRRIAEIEKQIADLK